MNMQNNPSHQDASKKMFENFPFMNPQNNPMPNIGNFDMNFLPKQNLLFPFMRNVNDPNWMNQMQMKNNQKSGDEHDKK